MLRFVARRLLLSVPVIVLASLVVFLAVRKAIDPTAYLRLNPRIREEDRQHLIKALGLDKPLLEQYLTWLSNFVRGDWGTSLLSKRSVFTDIRNALTNSLFLSIPAVVLSLIVGALLGVGSALRRYSLLDNLGTAGAFLGLSIPSFWLALLLQILVGVYLVHWFDLSHPILPVSGMFTPGTKGFVLSDRLRHLVLPMLVLTVQLVPIYSRYVRASMIESMESDYIRTARAKGVRERDVVVRHALRNSLIPLTTEFAINLGALAGGLVIIERIFQWPGMGTYFLDAMTRGDYPQVLAWLMVVVTAVVFFNLVADVLYGVLDPRIRYE